MLATHRNAVGRAVEMSLVAVIVVLGMVKARRKHLQAANSFMASVPSSVSGLVVTKSDPHGSYPYVYNYY